MGLKEEVLRMLLEGRGGPVSGEAIAERLGVSRTAVWIAVKGLKRDGYWVSAAPKRGYRLEGEGDVLTDASVRAYLSKDGPIRRVICLDQVGSTNDYAKGLLLGGVDGGPSPAGGHGPSPAGGHSPSPAGTLVLADRQTAGRGRRGRSFVSPHGGLYMSLILRPTVGMDRFQTITVAAAVAVCLALEELASVKPLIKWVNDVLLPAPGGGTLKICGILTEAVTGIESGEIEGVVVGIGVNLRGQDFGPELEGVAGSLAAEGDMEPPIGRAPLAAAIAERLMGFAGRLDDPQLLQAYRQRSMLLGHEISYVRDGRTRTAKALDVDERGALVVEDEEGAHTLCSGEVSLVRPMGDRGEGRGAPHVLR